MSLLDAPQAVQILFIALVVVAPFVGSYLGLVAVRLPAGRSISRGRSACDHCNTTLTARDLVPLFSWLLGRAQCHHCRAPISAYYPLVELSALAVPLWAATLMSGPLLLATTLFGWVLLTLALLDWRALILPDTLTLPLALGGLAAGTVFDRAALMSHIVGALVGFSAFTAVAFAYHKLRGREGLGLGDAKLLAALGAWVTWRGLPTIILYAGLIGLAVILVRSMMGRTTSSMDRLPFGSYLAMAGWLVWLYGPLVR